MKYCKKCGKKLDEDSLFCDSCGAEVKKEVKNTKKKAEPVVEEPLYVPQEKKGKGKVIAVIITLVILIAAIVTLTILLLTKGSSDTDDRPLEEAIIGKWEHDLEITKLGGTNVHLYERIEFKKDGTFRFYVEREGKEDADFEGTYEVKDGKVVMSYVGTDSDLYLKNGKLCLIDKDCKDYFVIGGTKIEIEYIDYGRGNFVDSMICTLVKFEDDYTLNNYYLINYNGDYVKSVQTIEEVESDDATYLKNVKKLTEETYKELNDTYGGYEYKVYIEGNKVVAETTINYDKLNIKKFIQDAPEMKKYTKDEKMTLKGVKALYEESGAICE